MRSHYVLGALIGPRNRIKAPPFLLLQIFEADRRWPMILQATAAQLTGSAGERPRGLRGPLLDRGGERLDQDGNRIGGGGPERRDEPLVRFAREQPITLAVIALGIGYLIGKVL